MLNFFELVVEFSVKLNVIFPMSPLLTLFGVLFYQEARLKQRHAHFKKLLIFGSHREGFEIVGLIIIHSPFVSFGTF